MDTGSTRRVPLQAWTSMGLGLTIRHGWKGNRTGTREYSTVRVCLDRAPPAFRVSVGRRSRTAIGDGETSPSQNRPPKEQICVWSLPRPALVDARARVTQCKTLYVNHEIHHPTNFHRPTSTTRSATCQAGVQERLAYPRARRRPLITRTKTGPYSSARCRLSRSEPAGGQPRSRKFFFVW